jgi:hypothetical protein
VQLVEHGSSTWNSGAITFGDHEYNGCQRSVEGKPSFSRTLTVLVLLSPN